MQPHDLTAVEQASAVRRGDLDPVELVDHTLRRVDQLDPLVAAFVTVTPERAMDAAHAARELLARADDPERLPPLLGVPTAIKDLTATAGVRTTYGSAVYSDHVPDFDDDSVRLLARAGAISVGKTAAPEFGLSCYTEPEGRPPTVTPWDLGYLAGGSSGGAAAAVAAGMIPFAHGTDGGGSIRIPASVCGLVGLKTSRGLVSRGPMGGDPLGFAVSGPLARTVLDAAAMLDALAAAVPGEPFARPPVSFGPVSSSAVSSSAVSSSGVSSSAVSLGATTFVDVVRRADPGRLRIGRYARPFIDGATVHPACLAAWERASLLLSGLGHDVEDADFGAALGPEAAAGLVGVFDTVWSVLAHGNPVPAGAEDLLTPLTRWWRERGARVSGPEFMAAASSAQVAARSVVAAHARYDVVLTPTLALPPRTVGWFTDGGDPAVDVARQQAFTPFTALYNITGQPALTLPLGWTDGTDGRSGHPIGVRPIGVQLVGAPGADALLLELGATLAAAAPWDDRHAPTW